MRLHCISTDCHCDQFILDEAVVPSPFGLENYWRDFTIMIWYNNDLVQYTIELEAMREGSADNNSRGKDPHDNSGLTK